jgi:hypothetical protein
LLLLRSKKGQRVPFSRPEDGVEREGSLGTHRIFARDTRKRTEGVKDEASRDAEVKAQ